MNSNLLTSTRAAGVDESALLMSRREALKRAALMLGVALSPALIDGVLRAQPAAGGKTVFLTAAQFATVSAVVERIFPKTNTPGALDVGVPAFVDLMAGGYMSPAELGTLTAGLADVEGRSTAAHQKAFGQLTASQQDALLMKLASEPQGKSLAFFRQIRELTIVGYFTSETVGKTVLNYDPVPGRYEACVPISETGNVNWTK
jgi:hypothetical protein